MSGNSNGNRNSASALTYHLVLVIRNRGIMITEEIFNSLMVIFKKTCFRHGIVVKEANWEFDHIHVLFEAEPGTDLIEFVDTYKRVSSKMMKEQYPIIRKMLWISEFWKAGYFIAATDEADIEAVRQYMEMQRKNMDFNNFPR